LHDRAIPSPREREEDADVDADLDRGHLREAPRLSTFRWDGRQRRMVSHANLNVPA
jgi:hypothetical protein